MSDNDRLPYRDDPAGPDDQPLPPPGPRPVLPAAQLDALVEALDGIADTEERAYAAARAVEQIVLAVRDPAIHTLVAVLRRTPPEVAARLDLPIATVTWAAARTGRPSSRI